MALPLDPAIPLLGIYLKEHKTLIRKNISTPVLNAALLNNHQNIEVAQVSINRQVDKITMGHLYNGIILDHKQEESFTICNSIDGPREYYAKLHKPVRERQISYDFNCMWNIMNKLN